jgi:hypothetical protein
VLEVALAWCRLTGAGEADALDGLLTDASVVHGLMPDAPLRGVEPIQRAVRELARMFPGRTFQVIEGIAEGDRAAVRWRTRFVPGRWYVAGMQTAFDGLTICTVRNGRVVELHTSCARWWV